MSLYCSVDTEFRDTDSLVQSLMENGGWTQNKIEIHDIPTGLYGYRGDLRPEKANIIIRKQHVGYDSNDIGFVQNDNGTYTAIISEYDKRRYSNKWIGRLKQNYVYHVIKKEQEKKGRNVERIKLPNGNMRVKVVGYR